jgi:hypothetical protein
MISNPNDISVARNPAGVGLMVYCRIAPGGLGRIDATSKLPNRRYLEVLLSPRRNDKPKQETHTGKPREYRKEGFHHFGF